MDIFPAIDLRDGKVVRLSQGDYNRMDVYDDNPKKVAESFINMGAKFLHVVDLDGAKDGNTPNFQAVKEIASLDGLFIEIGGGIRNEERIKKYLDIGVSRVILGTVAVNDFKFVKEMAEKYGDKIAVGVDASNGMVAVNGWLEVTSVDSLEFCEKLRDGGIKTVIYTDIAKDGELSGTNLEVYKELVKISGLSVTASGGVSFMHEIGELKEIGVDAAIVGKAIYTNMLDLKEVINCANS